MTLHRTTFCFVCTHLASGERDGDEVRRNSDVMEIMKRTRFPLARGRIPGAAPRCYLLYQWLQLRIQQKAGRVFAGWEEGRICFPPTYKYISNSDIYDMNSAISRDKRRTPAW
ncbi:hypothetical protein BHM03_00052186 [Ensete ventricosum]|nr:hypothetical protein BHM03_00052186 [Ensete ventricosum]